jgi:hypothetical protein
VAGAEIIHRDAHAQPLAGADRGAHRFKVFDDAGFGDFNN